MNYPVNRSSFVLTRRVDNEIEFWVKNIDRKAVPLLVDGDSMVLTIHITRDSTEIMTRNLTIVDAEKGLVRLTVTGEEAADMPKGFLNYGITMTRPDNKTVILYTDRDRSGNGSIEIVDGPLPQDRSPFLLDYSDFVLMNSKRYSSRYPGAAASYNTTGQHSVVPTLIGFIGRFTVQGTLEEEPSTNDWFDVTSQLFTVATTSNFHIAFEGNLMNVRFVVERTAGTIDQIVYRN